MKSPRAYALVAIAVLTLLLTLQVAQAWKGPSDAGSRDVNVARDFQAFYCAGATSNAGGNVYLASDFDRCGAGPSVPIPTFARSGVWAAPLPPYDVALFRIFALAPYRTAAIAWLLLSLGALTLTVVLVARLSGRPCVGIFAAFAMPIYYGNVQWGQLPPIVIAAVTVAAYALRIGAYRTAGIASIASLIEPHLGIPVCLAVGLCVPRARTSLAIGALVLGLASVASVGFATNVEYYRTILPLHAAAEAPAENQYSATWLAYVAGVPERIALTLGSLSYLFTTLLGLIAARALVRRTGSQEFLPVVPPAFAVLGGVFVHDTQIGVSLLLGIMLLALARDSRLVWLGLFCEIPFFYVETWTTHPFSLVRAESLVAVVASAYLLPRWNSPRQRLLATVGSGLAYAIVSLAILHAPTIPIRTATNAVAYERSLGANRAYTTGQWGIHIRNQPATSVSTIRSLASKMPRWLGLFVFIAATFAIVRGPRRDAVSSMP
ncbi:MAG: hypothetical protein NVS2B3_19250 [Vulcanimicrobiaceae bacterium]